MKKTMNITKKVKQVLWGLVLVTCLIQCYATHASEVKIDLEGAAKDATLIFRGEVIAVDYASSTAGTKDQPSLAHTFVTYKIEEIFKGKASDDKITLRFLGGARVDENGEMLSYLSVDIVPEFDLGDEDILFVRNNAASICPLVDCQGGRVRIIENKLYTEEGKPMMIDDEGALSLGLTEDLEEVRTHSVLDHVAEVVSGETPLLKKQMGNTQFGPFANAGLKKLTRHASLENNHTEQKNTHEAYTFAEDFYEYLSGLVNTLHTERELHALRITDTADPSAAFVSQLPGMIGK